MTIQSGRDDMNVVGVLNGGIDTGSKHELPPDLSDVQNSSQSSKVI